jgi:hypothetical protein
VAELSCRIICPAEISDVGGSVVHNTYISVVDPSLSACRAQEPTNVSVCVIQEIIAKIKLLFRFVMRAKLLIVVSRVIKFYTAVYICSLEYNILYYAELNQIVRFVGK